MQHIQVFPMLLSEVKGNGTHKNINIRKDLERIIIKNGFMANRLHRNIDIYSIDRKKGYPHSKGVFRNRLAKREYFLRYK